MGFDGCFARQRRRRRSRNERGRRKRKRRIGKWTVKGYIRWRRRRKIFCRWRRREERERNEAKKTKMI